MYFDINQPQFIMKKKETTTNTGNKTTPIKAEKIVLETKAQSRPSKRGKVLPD